MDVRKYKRYLKEVSSLYGTSEIEAEALFRTAIARAYDAIGSAYLWEDGTISLAMADRGNTIHIKHYIISAAQYKKIVLLFNALLNEYAQKRDTLFYAHSMKDTLIEVIVLKEEERHYSVRPVLSIGMLDGYLFMLPKNRLFYNERFAKNYKITVSCKGFNTKDKCVKVSRFEEGVVMTTFHKACLFCMESLKREYGYKDVQIILDTKTRQPIIVVDWKIRPSATVISFLSKEIEEKIGRHKLLFKEIGK